MAPIRKSARRRQLEELAVEISECRACPRLVAWREEVATRALPAYAGEEYWARPLAGFGDPEARLVVIGLAPAAHGGNRTGRMFTGDRSGDFLVAGLHEHGFATRATSLCRDDGLELKNAFLTAPVRCAPPDNKPLTSERDACMPYLERELALLPRASVYLALGAYAFDAVKRVRWMRGRLQGERFCHGGLFTLERPDEERGPDHVLCTYHPSQRNVFT
ncbi:MAG: uracil-DNA glycosylase, partial [Acidimicrobiales bacterium]